MKYVLALVLLGALAPAQRVGPAKAAPPPEDPIFVAMEAELGRARNQLVVGRVPAYFWELTLTDSDSHSASASFGALLGSGGGKQRLPRFFVRAGSYELDSTNYALTGRLAAGRLLEEFPLEDSVPALRHAMWLLIDRTARDGSLSISQKEVALRNLTTSEMLPDFAKAPPKVRVEEVVRRPFDAKAWEERARSLSAVYNGYPKLLDSLVEMQRNESTYYLLNTEGSKIRIPDHLSFIFQRASAVAPDGMLITDGEAVIAEDYRDLPDDAALRAAAAKLATRVTQLSEAPMGEAYVGPVLFEQEAAPQVLAQLVGGNLEVLRRPVLPPGANVPFPTGEFESRLNAKVLPESFTVVDDPGLKEIDGQKTAGAYDLDYEGVEPKAVTVIEKGVLKSFLSTRQPRKNSLESNGRARLPGEFGHNGAVYFSNLVFRAENAVPAAEIKKRFLAMLQERGKPYGLAVRRMDFPSIAGNVQQLRESMSKSGSGTVPVSRPLMVYKVYADGREELVRGLLFEGLNTRLLRDIVTASDRLEVFSFLGSRAPWALWGTSSSVAPSTVAAPAFILDEAELVRTEMELQKLPVVPAPVRAATR